MAALGLPDRHTLFATLTWSALMDWSEHYRNSGFVPWPLRAGLGRLAAQQSNLHRKRGAAPTPEVEFQIPNPKALEVASMTPEEQQEATAESFLGGIRGYAGLLRGGKANG